MTKELTDPFHDDLHQGGEQALGQAFKKRKKTSNIVGAGVPAPVHVRGDGLAP